MPHKPARLRRGGVYWHAQLKLRVVVISSDAHNEQPWRGRVSAAPMSRIESSPFAIPTGEHDELKGWIDLIRIGPVNIDDLTANHDEDPDEPLLSGATLHRIAQGINRYLGLYLR